jgi:hypothetical protein
MVVQTDSERVRLSRRLVLEFLLSSVDLSIAPLVKDYMQRYMPSLSDLVRPPQAESEIIVMPATIMSQREPPQLPSHRL